jgi:type II secretory pathway pseudopilin PulG
MGIYKNHGFTIIEVMLFLAVTGALTVAVLAGTGASINQQRYRDSVNSLKSYLQSQFSEVSNVINDRSNGWQCGTDGTTSQVPNGGQPRGTTDCVILGRLITLDDTGTKLIASNVTGYQPAGAGQNANSDIAVLQTYKIAASTVNQESNEVSWGAHIVKSQNLNAVQPLAMLIVRSPLSGTILTFIADQAPDNLASMITLGNMQQPLDLCVEPSAGTLVGQRLAVRIAAFAANQSAIEIPSASGERAPCQG